MARVAKRAESSERRGGEIMTVRKNSTIVFSIIQSHLRRFSFFP